MVVGNTTVATGAKATVTTGKQDIAGSLNDTKKFYEPLMKYGAYQLRPEDPHLSGIYGLPCNFTGPIRLVMGGKDVELSMASFILAKITDDAHGGVQTGNCFAGVTGNPDIEDGHWILGDVFLSNFVSLWDVGRLRFGLADP